MIYNTISFMSANFVARQLKYNMTGGWEQGDKATQDFFKPVKSYEKQFGKLLDEVTRAGFTAVDIWLAHLHPEWATELHIEMAKQALAKRRLGVASLAGNFGATPEAFEKSCKLAAALGASVLGGSTALLQTDRAALVALLRKYNLRFAYENHPEKTPAEALDKIGEHDADVIGACVDTGWYATHGYDPAKAIARLGHRIMHVHLKEVKATGAHDTCAYGEGVANIEACVRRLQDIGYANAYSVEHEPEHANPVADVMKSRDKLVAWLRPHTFKLPDGFVWGAATSSYQIEGAANEDGKGRSIWDDLCDVEGTIKDKSSGAVACDHYHRYAEDVALMKSLGLRAYRFSISWPRIFPDGAGAINQKGVDFYSRLIDELLKAGIEPFATLYHWDLPSALQVKGGWVNRDIAGWFADYAAACVRAFGDRARNWITLNEPWCTAFLGYGIGEHAPGIKDMSQAATAAHNTLRAHGMGLQAVRGAMPPAKQPANVGITLNFGPAMPLGDNDDDRQAAAMAERYNPLYHGFFTPIVSGAYSAEIMQMAGQNRPDIQAGDMALISQRNDFVGVNYYAPSRFVLKDGKPDMVRKTAAEFTTMDWEVEPDGLHQLLLQMSKDSRGEIPFYITENGASFRDFPLSDGRVPDQRREAYLRGHIRAVQRAIADGVDVRGYFAWSLMDNFEWSHGYQQWFGLVRVDYETQKRTPKDSALYYRDVIAHNAV